jgi:hypothetical protein
MTLLLHTVKVNSQIYTWANEIERRYGPRGLHGWSVHPGGIRTGLQRFSFSDIFMVFRAGIKNVRNTLQNVEQGASTTVWAATSRTLEGRGGKYLERCSESMPVKKDYGPLDPGHALHAYDERDTTRCWEETMKLVGLEDESTM